MSKTWPAVFVAVVLVLFGACDKGKGKGAGGAPSIAQKDGADGLKALFEASHAACKAKDVQKGRSIAMGLIPSKDQLKKIFKDDVPAAKLDELAGEYSKTMPNDDKVICVFAPEGRTEIRVHASSVEDLAAYKEGTPSFEEFPGGAKKLAETVLKPQTMFYEVEVTEPGKESGTKYHMFFWDGQWRMLGPAWRAFRAE